MAEIKINLLPQDLTATKKEKKKRALIINSSVVVLGLMIVITAVLLMTSLINKAKLSNLEKQLKISQNQVSSLKEKEALLVVLKTRISTIQSIAKTESPSTRAFNLITALLPSQISLLSFTADKAGQITVGGETTSLNNLQRFFNNLTDPAENQGTIAGAKVNSLNLNADGNLKFEVAISLK